MPLRSPKMYFCIFGFQRFVWWPKCTPASSSSFIVNVAMNPPSVCLRRAQQARLGRRGIPRDGQQRALPPKTRGVRDGELRRVLRVESHVFLAEIARPDAILAATEPQVDRDVVFRQSHDLPNPLQAHASGGAFSASPFASTATVSLVDWSESTVVRLKDRSTARCTTAPSAPRATTASVATKQNIVARWGSSIATPLAIPPIVTGRPPTSTRSADSLGRVSVVMMASAAPRPPWGDSDLASLGSAARILSIGSGTPMTPVDATSTWLAGIRSSSPTSCVISRASLMPCSPVQTLAQPLEATMAWACPP